jgi:hypothetical protein
MVFGIAAAPVVANAVRPALRPAAILTVIAGNVLMRTAPGDFAFAKDGAVLYVGTLLRTSADASAFITLFEGSTMELDAASDITIEDATMRDGSTIAQSLGRSWNVVMHLTSADSRYEPTIPAVTASVRGGEYEVASADALTGATTAMTTLAHRAPTTVAVSTSTNILAAAQTTAVRANATLVSTRSTDGAERVRRILTRTLATRALSAARSRDRANWSDRAED